MYLSEDEVARSIQDTCQTIDSVACKALPDYLDYWNPSSHRSFKRNHQSRLRGLLEEFISAGGNQCLVGRYDMLAVPQRGRDDFEGLVLTAHQL